MAKTPYQTTVDVIAHTQRFLIVTDGIKDMTLRKDRDVTCLTKRIPRVEKGDRIQIIVKAGNTRDNKEIN